MSKGARTLLVGATAFIAGFVLAMAFLLVGVYKVERLPSSTMAPGLPAGSTVAMGRHPGTGWVTAARPPPTAASG